MHKFDGYVVGAYATSPAHQKWDPPLEGEFFEALESESRIGALEVPWLGAIHPHDPQWFMSHFPKRFAAVLTGIPSTMSQLSANPWFGLASPDENSRQASIRHAASMRDGIKALNDAMGLQTVRVVELHSGPREYADCASFTRSLQEIAAWDWDSALLVIEHCDAYIPGQAPEKGFLTLTDEIAAIKQSGADIGISLNWGRSAIELRDAERVVEHVLEAKASGLLHGIIFSGASDVDCALGQAWIDAHHPFQRSESHPWGIPESLMTEGRVLGALKPAEGLAWSGVKLGWPPNVQGSVTQRVQMISDALNVLDQAKR